MKILMIATYYYPHIGGLEDTVKNYCSQFMTKGHEVEIITKKHTSNLLDQEIIEGVKVHRIPYNTKNPLGLINFWKWMWKNKKKFKKFDVVLYNDFSSFYWYLPLKFYFKKPDVILYYGYEGFPIKKHHKILRRIVKEFATKSINGGKYLDKYYGFKTDYYILCGTESKTPNPSKIKKKGAVFMAGLREDTCIMEFLKAIRILREKYKLNLPLDVYGDGPLRKKAEKYAKENNLPVKFHGWVANSKRFLYKYKYGFATQFATIMDCMITRTLIFTQYKVPITYDFDSEIMGNGAYGIISKTPEELAKKLHYYEKNSKEAKKILDRAEEYAKNNTWENIVEKVIWYLKEAIKN